MSVKFARAKWTICKATTINDEQKRWEEARRRKEAIRDLLSRKTRRV
jgi:hypothetical protein